MSKRRHVAHLQVHTALIPMTNIDIGDLFYFYVMSQSLNVENCVVSRGKRLDYTSRGLPARVSLHVQHAMKFCNSSSYTE